MTRVLRNSAKAVVIHEGRLLVISIRDGDEAWYILPGGGQEPEELLPQAVRREVAEEAGLSVACRELLFVIEGAQGEAHHRVDLVFDCEYLGRLPEAPLHGDRNQTGIAWVDVDTLNCQPLYPSKLRRQIMNFYQGKPHQVYLGNESVGDPECKD